MLLPDNQIACNRIYPAVYNFLFGQAESFDKYRCGVCTLLPLAGVSGGEKGARSGIGGFAGIGSLAGGFS